MDVHSNTLEVPAAVSSLFLEVNFKWGLFAIMLVLVVLSAFFSMSETAFSSVNDVKIRVAIEERKKGAKRLYSYMNALTVP